MNEIAERVTQVAHAVIDEKTVIDYMDSTGLTNQLLPGEKKMYINLCTMYGLNPFKREIYITAYGEGKYRQCSIVTGYEVYLKRAERIGKLDGYEVDTTLDSKEMPVKSTVTIYRKDWSHPFRHTVYFKEYVQRKKDGGVNKFWGEKPVTMIEKVAKAQAFRLCFPDEFDGMPYTHEEMSNLDSAMMEARPVEPVEDAAPVIAEDADAVKTELAEFLTKHEANFSKSAYGTAMDCLMNGGDCKAMIERCRDYLARKNIAV